MSQFRSEDMTLLQIMFRHEQGYETIQHLLELDMVHYVDLNRNKMANDQQFFDLLKRAEESSKKITAIEQIYEDYLVPLRAPKEISKLNEQIDDILTMSKISVDQLLSKIDKEIHSQADWLKEQDGLLRKSCQDFRKVLARIFFLEAVAKLFKINIAEKVSDVEAGFAQIANDLDEGLLSNGANTSLRIVGGTIRQSELQTLKKLIFRGTRGKALVHTFDLNLDISDVLNNKSFTFDSLDGYCIIFDDSTNMGRSIMKICGSFQADLYETSISQVRQQLDESLTQKQLIKQMLADSRAQFHNYLMEYNPLKEDSDVSLIMVYKQFLAKDTMIYRTLNMFKSGSGKDLLAGLVWVPSKFVEHFFEKKDALSRDHGIIIHAQEREIDSELTIPTYFRECEFATVGQMVVDQYEIPAYKEVNPGIFTSISFPFLFGVMFGDVFSGSLMLLAGVYFCVAPQTEGSLAKMVAPGRHFLLLMGIFSVFCGVIYNDFSSVSMYLFGPSCWELPAVGQTVASLKPDCVYPIGIDPTWYMATNEILFINSVKMKVALILGVLQMSLGIVMKGFNDMYNYRIVDFVFEFIPQLTLFMCLFGFMDLMVVLKWTTDYSDDTSKAPAIINTMLNMAMNGGQPSNPHESPLFGDKTSYDDQIALMNLLMMIVLICVPLMLCVKPCYIQFCKSKPAKKGAVDPEDEFVGGDYAHGDDFMQATTTGQKLSKANDAYNLHDNIVSSYVDINKHHAEDTFMEIMIHQVIEVIEFVLGTISNTASYLRLWALSLAHSQLAKVFYDRAMVPGFQSDSILMMFIGFFVFIGATLGVLMIMDVMECFLHTLRLHWVEFMSKFYKGDGLKFQPVTIKSIIEEK